MERLKLRLTNVMMTATKRNPRPAINTCFMLVAPAWPEKVFMASSSASVLLNRSEKLELTNQLLRDH